MLTIKEVSDIFRVSEGAVYRYVSTGKLQATKVGRRLLFDPGDVQSTAKAMRKVPKLAEHE